MSNLSNEINKFVRDLIPSERKYLLLKYDLATLSEAVKVIKRIEESRLKHD